MERERQRQSLGTSGIQRFALVHAQRGAERDRKSTREVSNSNEISPEGKSLGRDIAVGVNGFASDALREPQSVCSCVDPNRTDIVLAEFRSELVGFHNSGARETQLQSPLQDYAEEPEIKKREP